ncbi:MAG: ATP-dependent helicase, partial [Streptosporangiaceae bacterium]
PEEEDFLGLPGLLDPDQVRTLLRKRQDAQLAAPARAAVPQTSSAPQAPPAPPVSRQALAALRKERNGLVGAWSHRTGQTHGVIHNELRRTCGGPPLPQATADQIQTRIDTIRRWAIAGR